MTPTVSPAMRRKALALAELVPLLPRGRSKINGQGFYVIPSSTKPLTVAHYASDLGCTCEGFQRRATCTHQLACLLVVQRAEAPRIAKAQANRAAFGQCVTAGCIAAAIGKARRCDEHFRALVERLGI